VYEIRVSIFIHVIRPIYIYIYIYIYIGYNVILFADISDVATSYYVLKKHICNRLVLY
jgi:hypothetical protein